MICGFIDAQRAAGHGVESICRVLRQQGLAVAPRTYRAWKTRPPAARTVTDAEIIDRLRALRTGGPGGRPAPEILYGRRKMTDWLNRQLAADGAAPVSKHTVDRLMRQLGMRGLVRGRGVRTTVPAGDGGRRAADLLQRRFGTSAPNLAWVTDFTYVATWPGSCTSRSPSTCTPGRSWAGRPAPSRTSRSSRRACGWRCGGVTTPAGRYPPV